MQLTELELTNWGPFFGRHVIPLGVTEHAPVVLFRGENMRGKTSLLRGIVWALYGQLYEQDGRTALDVSRMVNLDALADGQADFGVRLKFTHAGASYTLFRTSVATELQPGRARVQAPRVDLIAEGGHPFPAAQIPEVVDGILPREISDFFLFDGEMLNRFEERLREERTSAKGFVRTQVERAIGLPFFSDLIADLDAVRSDVTANIEQAVRKVKAHNKESEAYREKLEDLNAKDANIATLREQERQLTQEIQEIEEQLAKVEEIKDLYHERKVLDREIDATTATIDDYRRNLAERAEANWWLPLAADLYSEMQGLDDLVDRAEDAERALLMTRLRIDQIEEQLASGVCSSCGQLVAVHNEPELRSELRELRASLDAAPESNLEQLRMRRTRLRAFSTAPSELRWIHDQELDVRKENFKNDKHRQRVRLISEQLADSTVEIDALERRYLDKKSVRARVSSAISGLEDQRMFVKQTVNKLGTKLAAQPEVDEADRKLQAMSSEAVDVATRAFGAFRSSMRKRVETSTSELFRSLTTESEYRGVSISEDYSLSVTDPQGRPLSMISAGANQILTMAFIGALGECSVDEAPMVMDTPFGRLDVGHRRRILEWVTTFERQVVLFVQSGEYDSSRDSAILAGKVGREYTIDRLSATRSEVNVHG